MRPERVDAERRQADVGLAPIPGHLRDEQSHAVHDIRIGKGLEHPLPGDVSAVGERVGVGGGNQDVTPEELVGPQRRDGHRIHEAELDEDQNIRERHARQRRGEAPALVCQLQPADGQSAEQPFEQSGSWCDPPVRARVDPGDDLEVREA